MNSISTVLAVLLVVARSCPLIEDRFCCDGEEFVNDCFVAAAGKDLTLCQHNECILDGGLQEIVFNSSEWQNTKDYVSILDSAINSKLLDSGVRLNFGCWDHQRLKQAKEQVVNGKNFYVKLQLLCDPLGYYAHIYFYLPINIDSEGHVLFPQPEFMGMQYPKLEFDALDRFETDSITVPVADSTEAPLVGNDAGEHGCVASAGYEWCEEEDKCYRAWEESCGAAIGGEADDYGCIAAAGYEWCEEESKCYRAWEEECGAPIGGEADEHNCYGSAGYVWCESNAKCYRVWEEDCPSATSSVEVDGGDEVDGSVAVGYYAKFQRIGIVALFVILGLGITVFCVARKKRIKNVSLMNTKVDENSVSYENLV